MRYFTCLIDPTGRPISERARAAYESLPRRRGLAMSWRSWSGISVLTAWDNPIGDAAVAEDGRLIAVGAVRLDNRGDIERRIPARESTSGWASTSDLELVLRMIGRHGAESIPDILGDFAFVVWDVATRTGLAACDAFAVRPLYHAAGDGLVAFASMSEALAIRDQYDVQYLAERVAYCNPISPGLTVYAGVHALPAATFAVLKGGKLVVQQYWSATAFAPDAEHPIERDEAVARTRQLLMDSVRLRLDPAGGNWAQLSGGVDSSGVVSIAQQLFETGHAPRGLDGTITYVDRPDVPDNDLLFTREVANRWAVRNERLIGIPRWHSQDYTAPLTDYPDGHFSVFPRDRCASETMEASGGRVLLTGLGGDELFGGNRFFYADLLANGRFMLLLNELTRRMVVERRSFWQLARRSVILPFLPKALANRVASRRDVTPLPNWYQRKVFRGYGIRSFGESTSVAQSRRIRWMYRDEHLMRLRSLIGRGGWQVLSCSIDVRHPFLYRPLVEWALQLPPELCVQPRMSKPVLRSALRGILPDGTERVVGAELAHPSATVSHKTTGGVLERLTRNSILAELGVVDAARLRKAVEARGRRPPHQYYLDAVLDQTLEVEAWLQQRSGRSCGAYRSKRSKLEDQLTVQKREPTPAESVTFGGHNEKDLREA